MSKQLQESSPVEKPVKQHLELDHGTLNLSMENHNANVIVATVSILSLLKTHCVTVSILSLV